MAVVRSPYAHARITSIDTAAAKAAEGVVAVFTGADLRDDWKAAMPCAWPVTEDMKSPEHFPLAVGEVHYEGDGVAVVIADTRAHAIDAAELVDVDYEPLDVLVDVEAAAQDGAALVHEELGTNVSYVWKLETGAFDDGADVIVKHRYVQPPLIPNAIEPRGVVARPEPGGDVTLWSATQIPHILRLLTAATLGMSETKLRVIAPDVGGGFGSKLDVYAEELLAVAIARRLGTPVKWVEERSENALATIHGRDFVTTLELAATKDGKITSIRANVIASMGAYLQLVTPGIPLLGAWIYAGPYAIPNYSVTFTGVFTNTTPTDAYRGAGRPEATYVLERTMDLLALELGIDRLELRRKNFISEFPATLASGLTIDNGDYHASLDKLLEHLGLDELEAEQQARRERGDVKQIGIGFSTYNEMCGLAPSRILGAIRYAAGGWETATIRCLPDRHVPGRHRHLAARPGPRDSVVADRRRPARLRSVRGRGAARRHEHLALRPRHVRQPEPPGRRRCALDGGREDHRQGARDRGAPARGLGRRPRLRRRHLQRQGLARQGDDRQGRRLGGVRGAQPPRRDGAEPGGDGDLRPAELLLAGRRPCSGRRGRHRDGRRAA